MELASIDHIRREITAPHANIYECERAMKMREEMLRIMGSPIGGMFAMTDCMMCVQYVAARHDPRCCKLFHRTDEIVVYPNNAHCDGDDLWCNECIILANNYKIALQYCSFAGVQTAPIIGAILEGDSEFLREYIPLWIERNPEAFAEFRDSLIAIMDDCDSLLLTHGIMDMIQ